MIFIIRIALWILKQSTCTFYASEMKRRSLTLFRMGIFRAAHGWRGWGAKGLPLPKIYHTHPTMTKLGTFIPYLKKIQKKTIYHVTSTEFCWHQHLFIGNQKIFLYQGIQIYIAFWYIISNCFNFSWSFEDFFIKPGYNFDNISKNGHPRPS